MAAASGSRWGVELFRGGYFGELESAVACCREYRDVDADVSSHSSGVVPRQDLWRDSWFPFPFGDGYCYAIECDRSDPAAIWRQWFHPEPTLRVYDDLEQLLETVLGEFRRDRYVWSWELNRLEDQLDRPLL